MLVNGLEARCAARVKPGDLLGFQQRVQPGYTPRGRAPFAVETVFEDDELAVVYKPSGARTTRLLIACIAPPPCTHRWLWRSKWAAHRTDSSRHILAGVVSHPPPGGATGSRSMRTAVQYALQPPPIGTVGALYRPHLVHRLDKALVCLFRLPLLSISHGPFLFFTFPISSRLHVNT